MKLFSFIVMGFACACTASAPSDNQDPGGGNGDCESRCETKASACGVSAADGQTQCSQLCGNGPTESQVECLEGIACDAIQTEGPACFVASGHDAGGGGDGGGCVDDTKIKWRCDCFGNGGEVITVCAGSGDNACDLACGSDCSSKTACTNP